MEKQEFDLSWFDLKKYEKLKELDLEGWYNQLLVRKIKIHNSAWRERIKKNPITPFSLKKWNWREGTLYNFDTFSVQSTTVFEISEIINETSLSDVWELYKNYSTADESQLKTIYSAINILYKERYLSR